MNIARATNAGLLIASAFALGCGGDDDGRSTPIDLGMDASVPMDAGAMMGNDAASDAGSKPTVDAGPAVVCSFTRSEITSVSNGNVSATDPIALTVRNDGASLSWVEYQQAVPRVVTSWFSSDRMGLYTPAPDAGTAVQSEPGNVSLASGFLSVWSQDDGVANGGADLRGQGWGSDGRPTAPAGTKLTTDGDSKTERVPAVARGADGNVLLVWQNAGLPNGTSLLLDATGNVVGQPHALDNFGPQTAQPVLAALNNRYVLAWTDPVALRVHMMLLDATGTPLGNDILVDVEQNAAGVVDLATGEAGGAIVFDVLVGGARPEVRFHTFDANGALTGQEVVITNGLSTGGVPSIVPIAGGYVIAYRSVKSPDKQVQLVLADAYGTVTGGISVASVLDTLLPVALRIAPNGKQMLLSWMDRVSMTAAYNLQRTWVTCD